MRRSRLLSLRQCVIPCERCFARTVFLFFQLLATGAIWTRLWEKIVRLAFFARSTIWWWRLFLLQAPHSFNLYWLVLLSCRLLLVFDAREQRQRQWVALLAYLCIEILGLESARVWWRRTLLIKLRAHTVHQFYQVERHCVSLWSLGSKLLEVFYFHLAHLKLLLKLLLKSVHLSELVCLLWYFEF
jgi:hypothetical protein